MKRAVLILLALGIFVSFLPAAVANVDALRRLTVLEGGRKKPFDTYARILLRRLSGRSTGNGLDACAWLARVLFTPGATLDDPLFHVGDPGLLAAIGVGGGRGGRFSFNELRPGLNRLHELAVRQVRSGDDRPGRFAGEVMRLFANVSAYYGLLDAFAFARPEGAMTDAVSPAPALVPLTGDPSEPWLSPAQALARGAALPLAARREIEFLALACRAYAGGDQEGFDRALGDFDRARRGRLGAALGRPARISLELLYNRVAPFFKAELAYGLALLLLLLALACQRRIMERLSSLALLAGLAVHAFGIIARMAITARPPVTNLYETFVFVSWTAAAMGLLLYWAQKHGPGLLAGGLAGLAFLLIADGYALDGDTMGVLTAVLDSNLWLTVHVITIALGYAGGVVAGIIGHVVLVQQLRRRPVETVARTAGLLHPTLAFGLSFTVIGTLMGGIWADLSWGRFWGWDPKENGALLIIIWCAVLLHARLAGHIGPIGLAAGSVGAIVCVALAWFGVNLLGLGLHAYGFTSGASRGLLAFIALELAFVAAALAALARKRRRPPASDRPATMGRVSSSAAASPGTR